MNKLAGLRTGSTHGDLLRLNATQSSNMVQSLSNSTRLIAARLFGFGFHFLLGLSLYTTAAQAQHSLELVITDQKQTPLSDAVVTLSSPLSSNMKASPMESNPDDSRNTKAVIDQIDTEFVPAVSVVPAGTMISFPNKDDILHHVYSFSPANTFDLPLYKGTPSEPVLFEQAGLVTLGCNIHDWMKAYVVVVDTPFYKISNEEGQIVFDDLTAGEYTLDIWHPRQRKAFSKVLNLDSSQSDSIRISIKPQLRSRKHSSGSNKRYN